MNVARYDERGRMVVRRAGIVAAVALALTVLGGIFNLQRTLWA